MLKLKIKNWYIRRIYDTDWFKGMTTESAMWHHTNTEGIECPLPTPRTGLISKTELANECICSDVYTLEDNSIIAKIFSY